MLDIVRRLGVRQKTRTILLAAVALVVLVSIVAAARWREEEYHLTVSTCFVMDTVVELKLYGKNSQQAADEIERRLQQYEQQYSMYIETSQISRINENAGKQYTAVSEECLKLLNRSLEISSEFDGLFDITIAPLTELWAITSDHPRVPSQQEIDQAKALVDYHDLLIDGDQVMLARSGQAIDLGAVAKGASCDIVREVAEEYEIRTGYVSIGGNLVVLGNSPDGEEYRFAIRDPQGDASEYFATLSLTGKTMATTGGYERWFEQDGKRYHHVLDPRTGYPAESDLLSVSVVSEDGLLADCLSTALFVAGKDAALQRMQQEDYQLIVVDTDGNVYYSPSLQGNLQPNSQNTRGYQFQQVGEESQ